MASVRNNPGQDWSWHARQVAEEHGWFASRATLAALERKGQIRMLGDVPVATLP